jgi:hypothetical protein
LGRIKKRDSLNGDVRRLLNAECNP